MFASADTARWTRRSSDDLVDGTPDDFATNSLEIATPPDNPAKVDSLDDLADPDVKVVVCAARGAVWRGRGATSRRPPGVDIKPVSEEQSVTDVLGKVISGEADAGLVYVTDVKAAGDQVHGVTFPESAKAVNTLSDRRPVTAAPMQAAARDFIGLRHRHEGPVGPRGSGIRRTLT